MVVAAGDKVAVRGGRIIFSFSAVLLLDHGNRGGQSVSSFFNVLPLLDCSSIDAIKEEDKDCAPSDESLSSHAEFKERKFFVSFFHLNHSD